MPYEFWLSFRNNAERIQLPVNPPKLNIRTDSVNESHLVSGLGEVTILQDPTLKTFDFSSFFPLHAGPYCEYKDIPVPWEAVQQIERWKKSGDPVRFIVTGTPINFAVSIELFTYYEGTDVGTQYYDLTLKEYVFTNVRKINVDEQNNTASVAAKPQRQNPRPPTPKVHVVKKDDTLWGMARTYFKDGARFKEIAELNGIKAPYTIYPNQEIKIPENTS